jgi:hypothetical protein
LVRSDLRVCASGEPESEPKGTWSQTNPGCSAGREKMVTFFQRLGHRASENKGLRPRRDLKSCKTLRGFAAYAGMTLRPRIPTCRKKGQPEGNAIKSDTGRPRVARSYRKTCNAADHRSLLERCCADSDPPFFPHWGSGMAASFNAAGHPYAHLSRS